MSNYDDVRDNTLTKQIPCRSCNAISYRVMCSPCYLDVNRMLCLIGLRAYEGFVYRISGENVHW